MIIKNNDGVADFSVLYCTFALPSIHAEIKLGRQSTVTCFVSLEGHIYDLFKLYERSIPLDLTLFHPQLD